MTGARGPAGHTLGRRHRWPPAQDRTGPYDLGQRSAAARLQAACPHWLILYGPWSRRHFAFPRFPAPPGTIVSASGTGDLLEWMRATELDTRPGPTRPTGGR